MRGVVIKSTGSWYHVRLTNGSTIDARMKGKFRIKGIKTTNPIAVGDNVHLEKENDGTAVITNIDERKNYLIRKSINLSKRSHIIAANIDQAILVVTLSHPKTYTGFIDRFLVTTAAYQIPTVLVFNKIDLYTQEHSKELDDLIGVYSKIGYQCIETSATTGYNIENLISIFKDKTTVILGHSGVGKSTLLNCIEPNLKLETKAISAHHLQGKHTTTFAEMHTLSFGGYIIDTPGIKAFGLIDFDKNHLSYYFLEMQSLINDCQFNNCLHINEPNCAVKKAVTSNQVEKFRYKNYLDMYNEDEEESYRGKGY